MSAVSSTDRSINNVASCVITVRTFSIFSPAIDYWPVTHVDATRVDFSILFGLALRPFPLPFDFKLQILARSHFHI